MRCISFVNESIELVLHFPDVSSTPRVSYFMRGSLDVKLGRAQETSTRGAKPHRCIC